MRRVLLIAALLSGMEYGIAGDDSSTPDNDDTGFNNSFEKAQSLGLVGVPEKDGKLRAAVFEGRIGQVVNKWDSVDFLKFGLPAGNFSVHLRLEESPHTTQILEIFDSRRNQLGPTLNGNAHEETTLQLSKGEYFLKIQTSRDYTADPKRSYRMSVTPTLIPNVDQGALACAIGAASKGNAGQQQKIIGSVSWDKPRDVYHFYTPSGAVITGKKFEYDKSYTVQLVLLPQKKTLLLSGRDEANSREIRVDPGHYCLEIEDPYVKGTRNYRVDLWAEPTNARPPNSSRQAAHQLTWYDLGPLSTNGSYANRERYLNPSPFPPQLNKGQQYVLREWIERTRQQQWFLFKLDGPGTLTLGLYGHLRLLGVEVTDQKGETLSVAAGREADPSAKRLAPLSLKADLAAGWYYVKVSFLSSTGDHTPYQMELVFR